MLDSNTELLSVEECNAVDAALLTSHGKFNARVAIYALRSLKQISSETGTPIAHLQPATIAKWVEADPSLQDAGDDHFRSFWTKLVLSAMKLLSEAAANAGGTVEDLSVAQVIQWFEQAAKKEI
ncbi:hypothetical protein IQ266_10035 [filamentous cyanobacterium LEGE 11480]|uniref:Uncharacterized protein n=1 Tax=Romeriopsis navalis LEGE 11480 TaxID=2777977 RepID=A0A928VK53_9CYAN|nr:hypothetical protein [Romeriopsis navalis]MBE9030066.1 hypothetical protein [Romeriopsis navalis LEGE 11480]